MMIAQGEAIPALDTQIQFPEGLSIRRYITPMMEHVMGRIYRVGFEDMAPHMFIVRFQICFTALSVFAVFLAAKFTWRFSVVGLLCAFIYAILPAAVMRTAGGNYIREDFALPFIFLSFAGWMFCMRCDRAERIYRQAVDLESGHQEALLGLGSVLLQLMRSEEALQVATVATHRFPDNAEAFENLARAYAILEDFPRAVSEAEKSLVINPENARLQAVLAKLRSKAREVE